MREALYRRQTWVWKGESYTGKVVFAPLHADVRRIEVRVPGIVLRVDAYDRPKETVEAVFELGVEQGVVGAEGEGREAAAAAEIERWPAGVLRGTGG